MDEGGDDAARASINEAKTSLMDALQERFDFLGYTRWQGAAYTGSLVKLSTENAACCVSNACH